MRKIGKVAKTIVFLNETNDIIMGKKGKLRKSFLGRSNSEREVSSCKERKRKGEKRQ